jgi:hypothetical protein
LEREAAAEIAMKIAALPDDPAPPPPPRRDLGSRVDELQAALHALDELQAAVYARQVAVHASLTELEAELCRSTGEGTLRERVEALRG